MEPSLWEPRPTGIVRYVKRSINIRSTHLWFFCYDQVSELPAFSHAYIESSEPDVVPCYQDWGRQRGRESTFGSSSGRKQGTLEVCVCVFFSSPRIDSRLREAVEWVRERERDSGRAEPFITGIDLSRTPQETGESATGGHIYITDFL